MYFSVGRTGGMAVAGLLSIALLAGTVQGQVIGPELNPYAGIPSLGAGVGMGAGMGGGWGGGWGGGFGSPASRLVNGIGGWRGLGGMGGGWGGYGGLYGGAGGYGGYPFGGIYGAFSPYLYGVMSNPYSGFLSGVASVTNANGQYEVLRQQAIKQRQENIRAVMENKIRQEEMENKIREMRRGNAVEQRKRDDAWALDEARRAPTQGDIFSGRALNTLLRNLIAEQRDGHKGPKVTLKPEDLQSINLTTPGSRANMGLLRNIRSKHKLPWPLALQSPAFADTRDKIDRELNRAVEALANANEVDPGTLKDLNADLQALWNQLRASFSDLTMQDYIEAKRFLDAVGDALRALEDPNISNYFNQKWVANAGTAGELVQFMDKNGLRFAPAVPGDEAAYTALYHRLRQYDAGMDTELASTK